MRSWKVAPGSDLRAIAAVANFDWKGRSGRATYLPAIRAGDAQGLPLVELLPAANSGKLHQLGLVNGRPFMR